MFKYTYSTAMFLIFSISNLVLFINYGLRHEIEFWACYGFVTFAYITMWFSTIRQENSSMMYLFAINRASIGLVYVVLSLIAAVSLYMMDMEGLWLYVPQIVIALFFIILLMFVSEVDDRHAEIELEVKQKVSFINKSLDEMDRLKIHCQDDVVFRKINNIIDILVSSQSTPLNAEIEAESDFNIYLESLDRKIRGRNSEECLQILKKMEMCLKDRQREINTFLNN